jgi:general secretion pathway protein A
MRRQQFYRLAGAVFLIAMLLPPCLHAGQQEDASETARLVAILLDAGRVTVAKNQELINDSTKADKGFTAAVFERQLTTEFQTKTGISLGNMEQAAVPPMAKPLLARLLEESKKTITSYQVILNMPGIRYKGLIPATFGTETASRFQNWSGVYLKQTAPSHLLRNQKNKPDDYEAAALAQLATRPSSSGPDSILTEVTDGGTSVRVILPLYYGKSCLSCHGEPKGERDISGYAREGAKEGDLGGAISVKLPLK